MNYDEALARAENVLMYLKPFCERVGIAGSIRRKKQDDIKDIEIVAVPIFYEQDISTNLTGEKMIQRTDMLAVRVEQLLSEGIFGHGDPDKTGKRAPCGPKYYRLRYDGEKLDLFVVIPPAQWGVIFAIRTGDKDFSHWLVTRALEIGMKVDGGSLYQIGSNFEIAIPTPEETDFFKALKVKWIEPEKRDFKALGLNIRDLLETGAH
ncbi:MAG: hypothetical protein ACRECH_08645 [Nitrososphaerales archaeon]